MGKISIFNPVLDIPLGTYPVPVDGKFICINCNTQFTIYQLKADNDSLLSLTSTDRYNGDFEFTVLNKKYKVVKGILFKV